MGENAVKYALQACNLVSFKSLIVQNYPKLPNKYLIDIIDNLTCFSSLMVNVIIVYWSWVFGHDFAIYVICYLSIVATISLRKALIFRLLYHC